MAQHYLSFADPDLPEGTQFLGAAIVESDAALGFVGAVTVAHMLGINPGGEVMGIALPDDWVPAKWTGRLLSRADLDQMDVEMDVPPSPPRTAGTPDR